MPTSVGGREGNTSKTPAGIHAKGNGREIIRAERLCPGEEMWGDQWQKQKSAAVIHICSKSLAVRFDVLALHLKIKENSET